MGNIWLGQSIYYYQYIGSYQIYHRAFNFEITINLFNKQGQDWNASLHSIFWKVFSEQDFSHPGHTWYLSFVLHSHILSHENFTLGKCVNLWQICHATKQLSVELHTVECCFQFCPGSGQCWRNLPIYRIHSCVIATGESALAQLASWPTYCLRFDKCKTTHRMYHYTYIYPSDVKLHAKGEIKHQV